MKRVLLVGAGLSIAPHLHALRTSGVETVDVVSTNPANIGRVRAVFPSGRDFPSLFAAIEADSSTPGSRFALIATPANVHKEQICLLAASGYDLLVEKPITHEFGQTVAAVTESEAAGRRLFVCLQHRYKEAAITAAEIIARGDIGFLVGGTVAVPWYRPQAYYDEPGRGTSDRDGGGVLITQAIHVLDLYLSLTSPVKAVVAASQTLAHDMPTEDLMGAVLLHEGGAISTLLATTATQPGSEEAITLLGSEGHLRLAGAGLYLMTTKDAADAELCLHPPEPISTGPDPVSMLPWYERLYADVLPAIGTASPTRVDARRVFHSHQVIDALYDSARSGSWIRVSGKSS